MNIYNSKFKKLFIRNEGFTLVEITIVMAIFTVLLTLSYTNFIRPQKVADYRKIINILRSDIRHQQIKTMSGEYNQGNATRTHGIYFEAYSYTLFHDTSYSVSDPANFVVSLGERYEFTDINLPSSQIVFSDGDGKISNYNDSQNTINIRNIDSGEIVGIEFGKYGVMDVLD